MKEEESEFKVTDRRLFREDGELREKPFAAPTPAAPKEKQSRPVIPDPRIEEIPPGAPRKIDFPSYILSYYSQSLVFLGEVPNPMTGQIEQDLESAQQMIDILSMLQDKTKGNLSKEEIQMLDSVLYELRMKFMTRTNRIKL